VYITGETKSYKALKDDLINKDFKETVKLRRAVETLQY
jgi:helix-turn-helix protein